MLSRVAGNIYWMARYLERAENTARLVGVNSHLLLDLPKNTTFGWASLIDIMSNEELFYASYREPSERNVIKFLLGDTYNQSSILSCLAQTRENMRTSRDIIPTEAWEQVNELYLLVKRSLSTGVTKRNLYDFLKKVILGCQQVTGIITSTMNHDTAYHFLCMGCYLERADMTTRILDVRSANLLPKQNDEDNVALSPFDNIQWMSVLKSITAYQAYRRCMRLRVKGEDVLKFLLQDTEFPRAVSYCITTVENCLSGLPKNDPSLRGLARVHRQIQAANVRSLAYEGLHQFIEEIQTGLAHVHDAITASYFEIVAATQTQS
jgi:uncharacterized alpha-E superfamily protein